MSKIPFNDLQNINSNIGCILRAGYSFSDGKDFYQFVNEKLIDVIHRIEAEKNTFGSLSEDQLSAIIVMNFKTVFNAYGFDINIAREANFGGHCDLVITSDNYTWLGEAKIFYSSFSYLGKGFLQLAKRYSTGTPTCCEGAILVYYTNKSVTTKNMLQLSDSWKKHLDKISDKFLQNKGSIGDNHPLRHPLGFQYTYEHWDTGLPFKVHNHFINLKHEPIKGA